MNNGQNLQIFCFLLNYDDCWQSRELLNYDSHLDIESLCMLDFLYIENLRSSRLHRISPCICNHRCSPHCCYTMVGRFLSHTLHSVSSSRWKMNKKQRKLHQHICILVCIACWNCRPAQGVCSLGLGLQWALRGNCRQVGGWWHCRGHLFHRK